MAQHALELRSPLGLWRRAQIAVVQRQQVPGNEARRRLRREHAHARLRGVDAQQQCLEFQAVHAGDHDLAVEDAAVRQVRAERLGELREVAVQRPQVA